MKHIKTYCAERKASLAALLAVFALSAACTRTVVERDIPVVVESEPGQSVIVERGKGPPPWAPAHGYRQKRAYRYYVDKDVYYNTEKRQYYWLEGEQWHGGSQLPKNIVIDPRRDKCAYIELEGDDPRPYHDQVRGYFHGGGPERGREEQRGKDRR